MISKSLTAGFSLKGTIIVFILEIVTVPIVVLTMGHAGPEGQLAILGWIALLLNLPGVMIAATVSPFDSLFGFGVCVFMIQIVIFLVAIFLYKYPKSRESL
jgi:hypothetical protein